VLDSVPDVHMVDWLPDFLDGLFHMLSDANREIRQAADAALRDFLQEIRDAEFVDLGPMVPILVAQGSSPEKLARQIAIDWITRFIKLGADRLVKDYSELLGAVMRGISDREGDIKQVAAQTNALLLKKVQETTAEIELRPLLEVLKAELVSRATCRRAWPLSGGSRCWCGSSPRPWAPTWATCSPPCSGRCRTRRTRWRC